MSKAKRKQVPSPPKWFNLGNDNCWFCKNKRNCNNCGLLKKYKKQSSLDKAVNKDE